MCKDTLLETNSSPLKKDGWKMNLNFFGMAHFQGLFFFAHAIWFPCEETLILCVIGWMLGNVKLGGWLVVVADFDIFLFLLFSEWSIIESR